MASKDDEDDKAAAGADGDPLGDESEGKGKKKLILLILAPMLVIIGGGAGLYFSGALDKMLGKGEETTEEHAAAPEGNGAAPAVDEHGNPVALGPSFLAIPDMIVNLSSPDGQPRYLRLKVQLELGSEADMTAVQAVLPRVVDQFQTYLRELRVKDLRGSAGIYRLQMELLARVNAAAYPTVVKDVLFQEILIQ